MSLARASYSRSRWSAVLHAAPPPSFSWPTYCNLSSTRNSPSSSPPRLAYYTAAVLVARALTKRGNGAINISSTRPPVTYLCTSLQVPDSWITHFTFICYAGNTNRLQHRPRRRRWSSCEEENCEGNRVRASFYLFACPLTTTPMYTYQGPQLTIHSPCMMYASAPCAFLLALAPTHCSSLSVPTCDYFCLACTPDGPSRHGPALHRNSYHDFKELDASHRQKDAHRDSLYELYCTLYFFYFSLPIQRVWFGVQKVLNPEWPEPDPLNSFNMVRYKVQQILWTVPWQRVPKSIHLASDYSMYP